MKKIDKFKYLIYLANKLDFKNNRSGETAIQKLIFLLINKYKIPLDYNYILYNYGPWSFKLMEDLRILENGEFLKKQSDMSGYGYNYIPNKEIDFVTSNIVKDSDKGKFYKKIDEIVNKYGNVPAKNLALLTTFIYICKKNPSYKKNQAIKEVKRIKPLYSNIEYEKSYEEAKQFIN